MSEPLAIRRLIDRITGGDIRVPAFQRDYVWEPEQVAFLLDSIYKGFPIGTVILWRTDTRLNAEKHLGAFLLPEPQKDYPVNYVLDGQQRLTSLFSAFQTELEPINDEWVPIYFDLQAEESLQESAFVALQDNDVDLARHFPMHTLFDPIKYRDATQHLDKVSILKIDKLQAVFKEYLIPNVILETDDRNKVAIVFERINRAGTELNMFELVSAWSWSEDFNLVIKFQELQEVIEEHGFGDLCSDKNLQLRICAGIITGQTTPGKILDLKGEEVRAKFTEIEHGIIGAIDFLKREANVVQYKLLPYPAMMVPLSAYFATSKPEGQNYTNKQKSQLLKWFWRSLFTKRFTSDVNQRQAHDIVELLKLRNDENYNMKLPAKEVRFDFQTTNFSIANADSCTHILLLSTKTPYSFLSGSKVDMDTTLKKASKHEFHHIFPKKYLESINHSPKDINVLANICVLSRADNNRIRSNAPSVYARNIDQGFKALFLENAFCPTDFENLNYPDFLEKRAVLLEQQAMILMD